MQKLSEGKAADGTSKRRRSNEGATSDEPDPKMQKLSSGSLSRIMAVNTAYSLDNAADTIISHLLEVGLVDTDYWLKQLQNHGVQTVASLQHLKGDIETYSSLLKNVRYKVEKKALAQLLSITESEEHAKSYSKEEDTTITNQEAELELPSAAKWDVDFQEFHEWGEEKFVEPKKLEERLNHVLKVKYDILKELSCTSKTWVNEYFTQTGLQHFLRTVMNSKVMANSQTCFRSIMKEILTKEEIDEIDESYCSDTKELCDWIYYTSETVASPQLLSNMTDFKALEDFFKNIQKEKCEESDSAHLNKMIATEVTESITHLRSHYKQKYEEVFILILIHPYLSQFSMDDITLRPLTLTDVSKLEKQFSEQRMKFIEYEKKPLHLQSYLLLLAIETSSNTDKEIFHFVSKLIQIMQTFKPPLEQTLAKQMSESVCLDDLKHSLLQNMTISSLNVPEAQKHHIQEANELFKKMGLSSTRKLKLQEALYIRPEILESSLMENPIADPTKLPYLVLHKLVSYDSSCRSNLLADINSETVASPSCSDSDYGDHDDESSEEERCNGIHPLDSLLTILIISDDFLRQDLFSRLAKCQLAVPFILPDPFTAKLTVPLWALRTIMNDFSSHGQQSKVTHSMVSYPMPIVSAIRFGTPQKSGPSKSKILNDIICSDNYDRFFHRNCPGGHLKSVLVDGLVDMCWCLPTGKTADLFPDAVTFLNLHGDAQENFHQTEFITQVSSMCLVMLHDDNIQFRDSDMKILHKLHSSPGGLTFLKGIGKSQASLKSAFPKAFWVNLTNKTDAQAKDMISKRIKSRLEAMSEFQSLENICKGPHSYLIIDENNSIYQKAKKNADELILMITNHKSKKATVKEVMLPLQGEALWKAWALEDKELHRQIRIGNETVNEYTEMIKSRKTAIRNKQLKHVERLTPVMQSFIQTLISLLQVQNYDLRNYFFHILKLKLNSLSQDNVSVLQLKYQSTRIQLAKLQGEVNSTKRATATKETKMVETLKKELETLQEQIIDSSFGLEHLLRELGQVYEAALQSKLHCDYYSHYLPKIAAELLIDGYPLELMDGDAAHVPLRWVTAVLQEAVQILDNPNVFVLSVLGLQSTGKSTMLNTAFGLQFNVSAGRCTRGAFMQLLKLDEHMKSQTKCDYVLVVDTEGLRAPELDPLQTQKHDNELATFVIGLANMTLVNIYGEVPGDMDDILQTSVHAFLRMHEVKYRPSCQFVHQNAGVNIKGEMGRAKFTQKLNKFTKDAAREENCEGQYESFNNVIKFNDQTDVHYFPGLWKGDPPMAPINPGYSQTAQTLKQHLIKTICKRKNNQSDLSLHSFQIRISDLWETLLKEKFVFSFKNTLEITAYNSLETAYGKWEWKFHSAMIDWEQKAENEINTEALESVSDKVHQKLRELQLFVSKELYDPVKSEMESLFNGKQMETMIQWKGRFERRLSLLTSEVKHHAEEHCRKLLENRKVITEFEKARNRDVEFMKYKVQEFIDGIKKEQQLLQMSLYQRKLDSDQLQRLLSMNLFSKEKIQSYRHSKIINDDHVEQINSFRDANGKFSGSSIKEILEGQVLQFEQVQKILKKTHPTQEELQSNFDGIWKDLIEKLPPVRSGPETSISYEVEKALLSYAAQYRGHDGQLISKIQSKSQSYSELEFVPQPEIHYTGSSGKWGKGIRKMFWGEDPNQIQACEITNAIFNDARHHIQRIVKRETDFKPAFTNELLRYTSESFDKHSKKSQWKFTPDCNLEVCMRVCVFAVPKFQEMADSFKKKNDPQLYLEKHVKDPLFTRFKNQYKQTETEEAIADTICAYLKTPIQDQVEVKLGKIMVDSMKASEHYFANKKALKVKVLKDLYHNGNFQEYMLHLRNVRQSLENHIEEYTVKYCEQIMPKNKLSRVQNAAKKEVYQLIKVIENAVSQINDTDIQTWMNNFCRNEIIRRELGVQLNSKELLSDYGTLQELNLDNFKQKIREELQRLTKTFEDIFSKITFKSIHWKDKPHELLNSLVGCTAQCPFCGEQCDQLEHEDGDHRTEVHRINCLAGWRDSETRVMTTDVCPTAVAGKKRFRKPDGEFHPYSKYKEVYKTWSIPPDITSKSCSYWKWFVGTHNDRLAGEYRALPADAPHQWSQITWSEIDEDLKSAYNV